MRLGTDKLKGVAVSLVYVLLLNVGRMWGQVPDFQRIDRSVVDVQVTCPFRADDDGLSECSGRATGVVISEHDGAVRILTALHEVHGVNADSKAKITVTFAFDQLKPVAAKLLPVSNSQLDLAVLEANLPTGSAGEGTLALRWVEAAGVPAVKQLWAVDGLWKPVPGSLMNVVRDQDGDRIRYTSEASNGYSGGPVLNSSGELVGIHLRSRAEIGPQVRDGVVFDAAMLWLRSLGYSGEAINRLTSTAAATRPGKTPASVMAGIASAGRLGGPVARGPVTPEPRLRPFSVGDQGTLLFRAGRFVAALPLLSEAARAGDGHAATILGGMYVAGQGVAPDIRVANEWWKLGAEAGDATSMTSLAASYVGGAGVPVDYVQGAHWYRKAAERNDVSAMTGYGLMFANGQINADGVTARMPVRVARDTDVQAVSWYRRASQAGDLLARNMLGVMYANGRGGLPVNYQQASRIYRSTADQGSTDGMRMLGDLYLAGRIDGARNFHDAVLWYRRAAAQGDAIAKERLERIAAANPGQTF